MLISIHKPSLWGWLDPFQDRYFLPLQPKLLAWSIYSTIHHGSSTCSIESEVARVFVRLPLTTIFATSRPSPCSSLRTPPSSRFARWCGRLWRWKIVRWLAQRFVLR